MFGKIENNFYKKNKNEKIKNQKKINNKHWRTKKLPGFLKFYFF